MESEYLQQSIGPVLTDAITRLLQHQIHSPNHPQNAIEFIAGYLMQHHEHTQLQKLNQTEHERIELIRKEVVKERLVVEEELHAMREVERRASEFKLAADMKKIEIAEGIAAEAEIVRMKSEDALRAADDELAALNNEDAVEPEDGAEPENDEDVQTSDEQVEEEQE